jgi:hypothetical protein
MGRTTAAAPGGGLASAPPARAAHRLRAADLDGPVARELTDLVAPHIDSFDYFLESGLAKVVEGLAAVQVRRGREERNGRRLGTRPAAACAKKKSVPPALLSNQPNTLSLSFSTASQLEHPATGVPTSFWFEAPEVGVPTRDDAPPGGPRLMPRDCREAVSVCVCGFGVP